jgi:diguanylate cyclase (GGDEF)-like protein
MGSFPSPLALDGGGASNAAGLADQRRIAGRVAGVVISLAALTAFAAAAIVRHPSAPFSFYVVAMIALCSGVACVLIRWERISAGWLHAVPVVATVEVAFGVHLAGVYGDIATNYYIFVVVFVSYAFSSRRAIAAHLAFVSAAASVPLVNVDINGAETTARTIVGVLVLVVIAGVVTLLREGLQERQRELEELAMRDPLTGVGNYRLLSERLEYEIERHRRSGESLTVMVLDLDGFKEINDTLGHLAGDRVLREVAASLSSALRAQDTLARQGGDEFSILAPGTSDAQAKRLATRVQDAIRTATSGSLTTSIGWATYPTDAEDHQTLLSLADAKLLCAKHDLGAGRHERAADLQARSSRLDERIPAS